MPHFVMECSENVLTVLSSAQIMKTVNEVVLESELFDPKNIKVRIKSYADYISAGDNTDFLHVFAYIMQGRNAEQKSKLSHTVITRLKKVLPNVPIISMNVMEFEKDTYCNKDMV